MASLTEGGTTGVGLGGGCCAGCPTGVFPAWLGAPGGKFGRAWFGLLKELGCCGVVGVGGSDVGVAAVFWDGGTPFFGRCCLRISALQK
jgi:hypothetical protein